MIAKRKKNDFLEILAKSEGNYMGIGLNHEKKEFQGKLE